jgi:hypothetical protein
MATPAGNDADGMAQLISINASTSRRTIPGSLPVTELGLKARALDGTLRHAMPPD